MSAAEEHVFVRRNASPALKRAMEDLAARLGRTIESLEGTTLGEAFRLACDVYGDALPDFWVIWNDWNTAPDDPQPMGDL